MGEVTRLAGSMLDAAAVCLQQHPELKFIVPFASNRTRRYFESITDNRIPPQALTLFDGQSRTIMAASDAILLASGTAALEAMLVNRPMVVTYRVSALSYRLMRALSNLGNVSLPNILAGREVVPELIQNDATADKMSAALISVLSDQRTSTETLFTQIHRDLRRQASESAADAVIELVRTGVATPEHR
jgi:lipid-A-disaccharide synthase